MVNGMKKIGIMGSTGSIGTQTLEIVRKYPDRLQVTALAAGSNVKLLEEQVREFEPRLAVMWTAKAAEDLRDRISDLNTAVICGMDGLLQMAALPEMDILVTAIVGMIGILPTIEAIRAHKDIALANKETLVTAGHIIMPLAKEMGVSILPVDSEHSAIFQSMQGEKKSQVSKILLTASGGPFRGKTRKDLEQMKAEDALKHPNWSMGQKITVDSATLMNKGLEFIEAMWLFSLQPEQIEIVVHPQSIIHSAVEFQDGAVIAQLGLPDMQIPIQYALTWPDRYPIKGESLSLTNCGKLTFIEPDYRAFACLRHCRRAADKGGLYPCAVNSANEQAVSLFLAGKIGFGDIGRSVGYVLDGLHCKEEDTYTLTEVLDTAETARQMVLEYCKTSPE